MKVWLQTIYLLEGERGKKRLNLNIADSDTVFGYFKFRHGQVTIAESVSVYVCWCVHVGAATGGKRTH